MADLIKEAEFKAGDKVTFKPYEKECKCVVMDVQQGAAGDGANYQLEDDDRIFYQLMGEAVSLTTGKSIMESKLFEPCIMDFDVSYDLLRRVPKERREISKENYRWILDNVSMTSIEVRDMTDAYNERNIRYKVRD